ncbi:hypothetical protein LN650_21315 [Klebsiella pneumoniae subsp. pneumoniae]|nr:hypothetical protein [Klebsiella pneumoniae subsp. pneumoniae]
MKILHSAIDTTGIDWDDTFTEDAKVFCDTTAPKPNTATTIVRREYLISDIDLTFDSDAAKNRCCAESKVSRHAAASDVTIAPGRRRSDPDRSAGERPAVGVTSKEENNQLVIGGLPEHFTLTIVNRDQPRRRTPALEGLYQSGEALCTQCEAEGFRHITPVHLDRPDVLARFTTKIIADKAKYPVPAFPTATVWRKGAGETVVTGYSGRIRSRSRLPVCAGGR